VQKLRRAGASGDLEWKTAIEVLTDPAHALREAFASHFTTDYAREVDW
jgi:hypothetical protein